MKSGRLRRPKDEFVVRTPPNPLKGRGQISSVGGKKIYFFYRFAFRWSLARGVIGRCPILCPFSASTVRRLFRTSKILMVGPVELELETKTVEGSVKNLEVREHFSIGESTLTFINSRPVELSGRDLTSPFKGLGRNDSIKDWV